ncbi:sulfite exporter TauE/SafE family protein [Pseudalkalibacillus hwajinpoensis]|uniref:sulfite exporter TauE/SafE family protein n=1 Tax=Guptibacillus hwajinpoensis TaxID=208199 RepID=UPI001CD3505D|nr:sulfite exporter TauE/SafE family protein [Pseudalkalibacillus hwajinpoensis]MCA0991364.1 sulfite exporter TauE/SafE family protein [Pseudalkalibacillus hwajinpoensis]
MSIVTIILIMVIGVVSGAYGMIVGAGGGFLFVPAILILFHLDPYVAAGTGLAVVFINSLSGVGGYMKQRRVDYSLGLTLSVGAIPGTFIGIKLAGQSSPQAFYLIFAALLISLGTFLFVKKAPIKEATSEVTEGVSAGIENQNEVNQQFSGTLQRINAHRKKYLAIVLSGILLGIVSSYFGIGGGWLLVPILVYLFKVNPHEATATSIFSLAIYSTAGVLIHLLNQTIDWTIVLYGGIGVIIGGKIGVILSTKLSGDLKIRMLSIVLIAVGSKLLFEI